MVMMALLWVVVMDVYSVVERASYWVGDLACVMVAEKVGMLDGLMDT